MRLLKNAKQGSLTITARTLLRVAVENESSCEDDVQENAFEGGEKKQTSVHLYKSMKDSAGFVTHHLVSHATSETLDCKVDAFRTLPDSHIISC